MGEQMMSLTHHLDRSVAIRAPRETVFRFFTDPARWAAWWGAGSSIDARPGGRVLIRFPGGTEVTGEVLDLRAPERISFSYGYASGQPIAPGGSRVTIRLEPEGDGTRLQLRHEFEDAAVRDQHVQGWRHQLSLFNNIVADEINAGAAGIADAWFDAWREADEGVRAQTLARIAAADVSFRDRFGCTAGIADLMPHITAAQHFMPGIAMQRDGDVRHCQGTALVDWTATGADGTARAAGTNVFVFGADGRIESVTGFWRR